MNAQDIATLVNFIDTAASRGAVRGDEMGVVHALRTKLVTILEEAQKAASVPTEEGEIVREDKAEEAE